VVSAVVLASLLLNLAALAAAGWRALHARAVRPWILLCVAVLSMMVVGAAEMAWPRTQPFAFGQSLAGLALSALLLVAVPALARVEERLRPGDPGRAR
jgi:hypothetical protein